MPLCAIRKKVRAMIFKSQVRSVVREIHESGFYPSQARVRELLPPFVDMREQVAYEEWKQAVAELGTAAVNKAEC
jgi:hypothetical protein